MASKIDYVFPFLFPSQIYFRINPVVCVNLMENVDSACPHHSDLREEERERLPWKEVGFFISSNQSYLVWYTTQIGSRLMKSTQCGLIYRNRKSKANERKSRAKKVGNNQQQQQQQHEITNRWRVLIVVGFSKRLFI